MITTTYTCDHCKEVKDKETLFTISLKANNLITDYGGGGLTPVCGNAHWCRSCLHKLGWFKTTKPLPGTDTPPPPATLEDLIRQLVIDTIQDNLSS